MQSDAIEGEWFSLQNVSFLLLAHPLMLPQMIFFFFSLFSSLFDFLSGCTHLDGHYKLDFFSPVTGKKDNLLIFSSVLQLILVQKMMYPFHLLYFNVVRISSYAWKLMTLRMPLRWNLSIIDAIHYPVLLSHMLVFVH